MRDELADVIEQLRAQSKVFDGALLQLERSAAAVRQDAKARAYWERLVADGRSIRVAVQTAGRMIDGARKWVNRTFQTEALDAIPFANDVVITTTRGALSSVNHWLERANKFLPHVARLQDKLAELPEDERAKLAEAPATPAPVNSKAALLLLAILGGVIWISRSGAMPHFLSGGDDGE